MPIIARTEEAKEKLRLQEEGIDKMLWNGFENGDEQVIAMAKGAIELRARLKE